MFLSTAFPHSTLPNFDIYALSSLIKDQFENRKFTTAPIPNVFLIQFSSATRGDSILVYPDGQTLYVHCYDCVTYHIVDRNTADARCVITCMVFIDAESNHKLKCQLSYYTADLSGGLTIPQFWDIIVKDQMVLGPGDMYELLMSHRIHSHLVEFDFA
ncbi:hypothetical protein DFH28DRAFT_933539 [Melampsora americana]|nr:hypothetical protein DFH28DRAFT_933539 [Melampsora americana]